MGIPTLVILHLYTESGPWAVCTCCLWHQVDLRACGEEYMFAVPISQTAAVWDTIRGSAVVKHLGDIHRDLTVKGGAFEGIAIGGGRFHIWKCNEKSEFKNQVLGFLSIVNFPSWVSLSWSLWWQQSQYDDMKDLSGLCMNFFCMSTY